MCGRSKACCTLDDLACDKESLDIGGKGMGLTSLRVRYVLPRSAPGGVTKGHRPHLLPEPQPAVTVNEKAAGSEEKISELPVAA